MAAVLTTDLYRFILLGDTPSSRVYYEPLGTDDKSLSAAKYVDVPMTASSFVTLAGANLPVGTKRVFILGVRGTVRYNTSGSLSGVTVGLEPTALSDVLVDGMMLGIDIRAAVVTALPRYVIIADGAGGTLVCDPIGVNGESLDDPISVSAPTIEAQTFVVRADTLLPAGTEGVRIISVVGNVYFNTSGTADGDIVTGREPTTGSLKAVAGMTWGRIDKLTVESSDGVIGGSTQYEEGVTIANPTGNVLMGKDPGNILKAVKVNANREVVMAPVLTAQYTQLLQGAAKTVDAVTPALLTPATATANRIGMRICNRSGQTLYIYIVADGATTPTLADIITNFKSDYVLSSNQTLNEPIGPECDVYGILAAGAGSVYSVEIVP